MRSALIVSDEIFWSRFTRKGSRHKISCSNISVKYHDSRHVWKRLIKSREPEPAGETTPSMKMFLCCDETHIREGLRPPSIPPSRRFQVFILPPSVPFASSSAVSSAKARRVGTDFCFLFLRLWRVSALRKRRGLVAREGEERVPRFRPCCSLFTQRFAGKLNYPED